MARYCLFAVFTVFALGSAAGCAEELALPPAPTGDPCESLDDCAPNDTPACGHLRACVDGVCEAAPSVYRPCP
jgi:hypothetical protein